MLYQDINSILAKVDADFSAAESHGMAAGMLCADDRTEPGFWLGELLQNADEFNDEDRAVLQGLFEETKRLLASDEFAFELLLPDTALSEQLAALRQWCQGFLFGLGAASSTSGSTANWPQDSREVVKDIAEFTKLDSDVEGEEAENDFMEITEYLRAAVIFLCAGLNSGHSGTIH
jgi:uncharacterized protein